jgi:hypothetical protein
MAQETWQDRLPDSREPRNGTTRERRSRRLIDRITREVLVREAVIDSPATFNQILFIVKFRRDTDTIKVVQVRYHDDGED